MSEQVMYSDFLSMVNAGAVHSARIDDSVSHVYFRTRAPSAEAASTSAAAGAVSTGTGGSSGLFLHCDNMGLGIMAVHYQLTLCAALLSSHIWQLRCRSALL